MHTVDYTLQDTHSRMQTRGDSQQGLPSGIYSVAMEISNRKILMLAAALLAFLLILNTEMTSSGILHQ